MTQVATLGEAAELELDPTSFASESGITYHTGPGTLRAEVRAWPRNLSTEGRLGSSGVLGIIGLSKLCSSTLSREHKLGLPLDGTHHRRAVLSRP